MCRPTAVVPRHTDYTAAELSTFFAENLSDNRLWETQHIPIIATSIHILCSKQNNNNKNNNNNDTAADAFGSKEQIQTTASPECILTHQYQG